MPLSVNYLQGELFSMNSNSKGAGDSIGVAITRYVNTMYPVVTGLLKQQLDTTFIYDLNSATYINPLKVVLPIALDKYKLGLIPIISVQNPGIIAIPPPTSAASFITPILSSPQSKESFIGLFSTAIDGWFRTGTYSVSGGPPLLWN